MFRFYTPLRVGVCILAAVQLVWAATEDSVYTRRPTPPDFLAQYIAMPLPAKPPAGLSLVGWEYVFLRDSAFLRDTLFAEVDTLTADTTEAALQLVLSLEEAQAILRRSRPFLSIRLPGRERWTDIDSTGQWITFYEEHDGTDLVLPSTASLSWYIPNRIEQQFRVLAQDKLTTRLQPAGPDRVQRSRTIELLGADIAGQRVSLRVSGNVAINGGMVFKDQSKSFTNFRANRSWDVVVDQKQRFDIEGTIGDRINVLVHQDSENDFEWENDMKIAYTGQEDEILQRIDAGNISLSLPGTQFATGGSGKSSGLFGIKAESKLGPIDLTTVASIERSRKSSKSSTLAREYSVSDIHYLGNRYFFLDRDFRASYYPLTKDLPGFPDGIHLVDPQKVVTRLEVYRSSQEEADTYHGTAYVDPDSLSVGSSYETEANFKRLTLNEDYGFDPQLGWIRLRSPAMDSEIIAVAYALGDTGGTEYKLVGDINYDPNDTTKTELSLKLIKAWGQTASHPTWPLEFKNVYSLGGMNINPEGFEVKIVNRRGATEDDDRFTSGESYLTIFNLDQQDVNGASNPDELIDVNNPNIVNLVQGELHFPSLLPFCYSKIPGLATDHAAISEVYGYQLEDPRQTFNEKDSVDYNGNKVWDIPAIYYKPKNTNAKNEESRFEIIVKQSSRGASEYNLGFNLVEGSETVYINGSPLARDRDYRIDYFSGTLTILDMGEYGADPEISIDYEENVLISFDKKVMLGTRAEMDLGENSFLGATGLYYNQSKVDERVEVGAEPVQNMLWDINGRFARNVPLLTRLVDRLPLLQTDAASRFQIEGEIAQVLPDPNPLGVAFVDDFESAKRTTSPSLQYRAWQPASPPAGKRPGDRRKLAWWNPYLDVNVRDIWPQRQTSIRARNMTTSVLVLNALFEEGYNGEVRSEYWGGITYPLLASDYDQTLSKFFEIWIKGTTGRLHIDVGTISEDVNANGLLNTEDRPVAGFTEGNGLLDKDEDVGLDGCPDAYEDGMGGCLRVSAEGEDDFWDTNGDGTVDASDWDRNRNGIIDAIERRPPDDNRDGSYDLDDISIAEQIIAGTYEGIYDGPRVPWADPEDPNGDNFDNSQAGSPSGRNDDINGTEGNSRIQEGSYPDTEDLDGLGGLYPDERNDYFTYSIQLDPHHPEYDLSVKGGETVYDNGQPTGWRLYRIPLSDFTRRGDSTVSWEHVKHLRLWIDGLEGTVAVNGLNARLQIAKIEFVGNEWEELGLAPAASEEYVKVDTAVSLAVTVTNTEDNADYVPPPGVQGEYDRLNDIRLREQSLALDFRRRGIPPGFKGAVKKSVPKKPEGSTFLVYGTMDMFIFAEGVDDLISEDFTYAQFWLRLGQGDNDYYEVRRPVYSGGPDAEHQGWDKRNHLSLNLSKLAGLKLREMPDTTIYISGEAGGDTIPGYFLDRMEVYIRGEPSLERIDRYVAGIINTHPSDTLRGRVMMDELRLGNVNREKGMAMRISGAVNFADLLSTSFNYKRQDADFHTVQQRVVRNAVTNESWQAVANFSPEKFLPQSWGVRIPVSLNYSYAISSPKYIPGMDILAGGLRDAPVEIQNRSEQVGVKTSFSKSTRSRNWLVRQTLDRLNGSISYTQKQESSVTIQSNETQNISGQLSYPIKFGEENYIHPFKVLGSIPILGQRLKETRFYYTPANLDFSTNMSEALTQRVTRALPDSVMETYNFNMSNAIRGKYRITDNLDADYSLNTSSVLDHYRFNKLEALKSLDPGLLRQFGEQFSFNYNPAIISWLQPKLNYQARYTWVKNAPLDEPERGGKISTQGRLGGNLNLKLTDIIEVFYTPESSAKTSPGRRGRRGATQTQTGPESKKLLEVKNEKLKVLFKALHTVAGKVSPISINYAYSRRGGEPAALGQPSYAYRMALVTESGLPIDVERMGGLNLLTEGQEKDISWRTGLNISRSINLNLSHAQKWSQTFSQSASTQTSSEDFLVLGDTKNVGIPFASWSLRWSNLEKLPLLNKIPWRVSLDHTYSGRHSRNIQNARPPVDDYTRQFQPLVGLTLNFNNGITSTIRTSNSLSLRSVETGKTKKVGRQITATLGYQHRGGFKLPLPFFKDLQLQNTINLTLDFDFSQDETEELKGEATKYTTQRRTEKWSIAPRISYTFTDKVTGGFRFLYEEYDDYVTGKRINRDFKFDVNIAIRGS